MNRKKGLKLFRKKESKSIEETSQDVRTEVSVMSPVITLNNGGNNSEQLMTREMSNERFQELLIESRRRKSDWIDQGREESEISLWTLLMEEPNILKLSNCLHPSQNQLKNLGTEIGGIQIISPALNTLTSILDTINSFRTKATETVIPEPLCISTPVPTTHTDISASSYCLELFSVLNKMQLEETEKLKRCDITILPRNISIDANQTTNEMNAEYQYFLEWLKDSENHELYVRIRKFISSIQNTAPGLTSSEREKQSEILHNRMKSFVKEATIGMSLTDAKRMKLSRFLYKFICILCYPQIMSCLPSYVTSKEDHFLNRCRALSHIITFENLGHDNRHTVAQYKEYWDCAIEQMQVISMYHNVEDKVICLNNAINILTRLLETIFGVVGADELMDGVCIVVMHACVPQLKLQLQMMDYYYEEVEKKRGVFESIKLRIRGIISFIKNCKFTDFCKLNIQTWEHYMGKEGEGLCKPRSKTQISSDDLYEDDITEESEDETQQLVQQSVRSKTSQTFMSLFGKKTKKIVEGKWKDCLDPKPDWDSDDEVNDELVKMWKTDRYRYYKVDPKSNNEQEYRNVVRTVENLLFLVRS